MLGIPHQHLNQVRVPLRGNGNVFIFAIGLECWEYHKQYSNQVGVPLRGNSNVFIFAIGLECWEYHDQYLNKVGVSHRCKGYKSPYLMWPRAW
jgi:hypothetical protein